MNVGNDVCTDAMCTVNVDDTCVCEKGLYMTGAFWSKWQKSDKLREKSFHVIFEGFKTSKVTFRVNFPF